MGIKLLEEQDASSKKSLKSKSLFLSTIPLTRYLIISNITLRGKITSTKEILILHISGIVDNGKPVLGLRWDFEVRVIGELFSQCAEELLIISFGEIASIYG